MGDALTSWDTVLKQIYTPDNIQALVFREHAHLAAMRMAAPHVSLAVVTAVATVAGLEWLRQRKLKIAAEDEASLMQEFWQWLRMLVVALLTAQRSA